MTGPRMRRRVWHVTSLAPLAAESILATALRGQCSPSRRARSLTLLGGTSTCPRNEIPHPRGERPKAVPRLCRGETRSVGHPHAACARSARSPSLRVRRRRSASCSSATSRIASSRSRAGDPGVAMAIDRRSASNSCHRSTSANIRLSSGHRQAVNRNPGDGGIRNLGTSAPATTVPGPALPPTTRWVGIPNGSNAGTIRLTAHSVDGSLRVVVTRRTGFGRSTT